MLFEGTSAIPDSSIPNIFLMLNGKPRFFCYRVLVFFWLVSPEKDAYLLTKLTFDALHTASQARLITI